MLFTPSTNPYIPIYGAVLLNFFFVKDEILPKVRLVNVNR